MLSLFGALATIVAAIGIYTVVTFGVVQRTRSLVSGWLSATMAALATMVLAQSAIPMVIGIVLGLGAASALANLVGTLLYEVNPRDAITFGAASVLLLGIGLISSLPPVRRVFRIDPTTALRAE